MSGEIGGISGRPLGNAGGSSKTSAAGSASGTASNSSGARAGDDSVSLTRSAAQLQALTAEVSRLPVVDAQLVSDVQQSLATGSFQFEPAEAAENLLAQERELAKLDPDFQP